MSWQERILDSAELPVAIISGWESNCPTGWTTAGMIGINVKHHTRAQEIGSSAIFCMLIAIQWIVVGGMPLVQPRRWWWLEPGACNTACSLLNISLVLIAELNTALGGAKQMANVEMLYAFVGFSTIAIVFLIDFIWVVWLVLLLWKSGRSGWKYAFSTRESSGDLVIKQ